MKIVTFNIQYGLGGDGRYDLARTARAVAGADVITLQEVERWWQRSGYVDQAAEIARHLEDYHWVFGANLDIDASIRTPEGKPLHRRRQFGNMILSRTPILSSRNFPLPKHGTLTQHSIQQGLLEVVVETPSGPLRVYTTHLSHLAPETRMPQAEHILGILERAYAEGGAWCGGHPDPDAGWTEGDPPPMPREAVLTGDLNLEAGSAEYERLVGPCSPRHGRLNRRGGLVDAWVAAGHDERAGDTCAASDHRPVWFELHP
jgi:endonuclease/exonuclease/phosphatase family metal-dependent hydrolase